MNSQAQMIRIISLVWIFALLSGCSWMRGSYESPDVKLVKVDVVKARLLEQQFMLHFSIDNPNDFGYIIRGLMVFGYEVIGPKYVGTAVVAKG